MDITECKGAEVQLKDYADKLAQSNRELEQFTYVVSHDLKAPLHRTSTRLEFLTTSQETSNDNAQYQIERISIIILENLEGLVRQKSPVIKVQSELPAILANEIQLCQVFPNLISNGIKFCTSQPQITISATCQGQKCTFCFTDNGIEIPRKFQQQDGHIWIESELGQGSKFFFTLKEASNAS